MIYKTDAPIFMKLVAKCKSLQPLYSEIKGNLCDRIPSNEKGVGNIINCSKINWGTEFASATTLKIRQSLAYADGDSVATLPQPKLWSYTLVAILIPFYIRSAV